MPPIPVQLSTGLVNGLLLLLGVYYLAFVIFYDAVRFVLISHLFSQSVIIIMLFIDYEFVIYNSHLNMNIATRFVSCQLIKVDRSTCHPYDNKS